MRDRNRLRNILAAGLLTGLVLATMVAFGLRDARGTEAASISAESAGSLETENEQLRQALNTLQAREAGYQAEIEAANQTILELQSSTASSRYDDDEDYEHEEEEDEREEHEHEEDDGWWDND
jgi:TolA-binding protein